MHSSTSSSDQRAPHLNYGALMIAVGILMLAGMGVLEFWLRSEGCTVSYSNSHVRWCVERDKLNHADKDAVAVLGASRVQLGFDPQVFRERFPGREIIYLPECAVNPVPTLLDVVRTTDFSGTLLMGTTAFQFAAADQPQQPGGRADPSSVGFYHANFTPLGRYDELGNLYIEMALQSHLVMFAELLPPDRMIGLRTRQPDVVRRDRFCELDYTRMMPRQLAALDPPGDPDNMTGRVSDSAFDYSVSLVKEAASAMRDRGGRLILVRFPLYGNVRAMHARLLPRQKYWDRIGPETGAKTLFWSDIPGIPDFKCLDGSHLDYRDAAIFTNDLLDELDRRGLLATTSGPSGV